MGLVGVVLVVVPILVGAAITWFGTNDMPLPQPLGRFYVTNVDANILPNPDAGMRLEGVLAPNDALRHAHKLEGVASSETVAINPLTGNLTLLDKFGYLYNARPSQPQEKGSRAEYELDPEPVAYVGPGRPLGFMYDAQGNLVFADSLKGLMSYDPSSGSLSVLANAVSPSSPLDPRMPLTYVNDLDIARDGSIYFSSSQEIPVLLNSHGFYDTFKAYMLGLYSGCATGRLLRYDPASLQTHVLAKNIWYANGVAVAPDQSYVAVVETSRHRVLRYWLSGARAGQLDVLVERLPGMPDGIKAAPDGGFWVGLVTPLAPVLRLLKYKAVRALMAHLPDWARPPIAKWGAALKLDASGVPAGLLMDADGRHVAYVSSVHQHGNRLFFGNVKEDYVSWLDLDTVQKS